MPAPDNLILLIEDSEDDAFFFKRAMEQAKLPNPLRVVEDAAQAICYLEGSGSFAERLQFPLPRIVFVDLHTPGKDGFEFLKWLGSKPHFRSLHVVAISGV